MNRKHVLFHLQEGEEELARTIEAIRTDSSFDVTELQVALQHMYHHVNTAWNGRHATDDQSQNVTDETFREWSRYPDDIPTLE